MNEALQYIEVGLFIIGLVISIGFGIKLRHNAKAHEKAAQTLDEKIQRANLTRAASTRV